MDAGQINPLRPAGAQAPEGPDALDKLWDWVKTLDDKAQAAFKAAWAKTTDAWNATVAEIDNEATDLSEQLSVAWRSIGAFLGTREGIIEDPVVAAYVAIADHGRGFFDAKTGYVDDNEMKNLEEDEQLGVAALWLIADDKQRAGIMAHTDSDAQPYFDAILAKFGANLPAGEASWNRLAIMMGL